MNRKFMCKSNYVLRKVINKEKNLDIIKDFIEAILKIEISEIILRPYLSKLSKYLPEEENFGVADVRIKTKDNEEINVGIQFVDGYFVQNKLLLYFAQIHANQKEHKNNNNVVRTVTINILDYNYFKSDEFHKIIKLKQDFPKDIEEDIELHVLELSKFDDTNVVKNKEDAWVAYFKGSDKDLINIATEKFNKIQKLDKLLDEYWTKEKME